MRHCNLGFILGIITKYIWERTIHYSEVGFVITCTSKYPDYFLYQRKLQLFLWRYADLLITGFYAQKLLQTQEMVQEPWHLLLFGMHFWCFFHQQAMTKVNGMILKVECWKSNLGSCSPYLLQVKDSWFTPESQVLVSYKNFQKSLFKAKPPVHPDNTSGNTGLARRKAMLCFKRELTAFQKQIVCTCLMYNSSNGLPDTTQKED